PGAPRRASPGRSARSARRDGRAATPLHPPGDRRSASGARMDPAGTGWGSRDVGSGPGAHTDPGRWLFPGLAPGVSRLAYGAPHRGAVLGVSPRAPRCDHDRRHRAPDHHDGRELRVAGGGARARAARGGDGRGRVERQPRVSLRPVSAGHVRSLTLEGVSFWYPATDSPALRNVSLRVARGEIVALVGALGAGASTLLLVAADLAPRVTGGRLTGSAARHDRSGIVLPTPWTQASGMAFSVWDEVAFGPANLGWPTHEIARQVDRALEQLELAPLASRDPVTLSGGELQRVIIAAILAMDPGLVLLDEPAAELDSDGARTLWRLIRLLAKEGKAVLLATSTLDA